MAASEPDGSPVRLSWILVFLLLSLGLGAAAVLAVGGDVLPTVDPSVRSLAPGPQSEVVRARNTAGCNSFKIPR